MPAPSLTTPDLTRMLASLTGAPPGATLVAGHFANKALVLSCIPGDAGAEALIQLARAILDQAVDILSQAESDAPTDAESEPFAEQRMQVEDALAILPDMHDEDDAEDVDG